MKRTIRGRILAPVVKLISKINTGDGLVGRILQDGLEMCAPIRMERFLIKAAGLDEVVMSLIYDNCPNFTLKMMCFWEHLYEYQEWPEGMESKFWTDLRENINNPRRNDLFVFWKDGAFWTKERLGHLIALVGPHKNDDSVIVSVENVFEKRTLDRENKLGILSLNILNGDTVLKALMSPKNQADPAIVEALLNQLGWAQVDWIERGEFIITTHWGELCEMPWVIKQKLIRKLHTVSFGWERYVWHLIITGLNLKDQESAGLAWQVLLRSEPKRAMQGWLRLPAEKRPVVSKQDMVSIRMHSDKEVRLLAAGWITQVRENEKTLHKENEDRKTISPSGKISDGLIQTLVKPGTAGRKII